MAQYEMNLRDYWMIVRRRRSVIIVSTVLVALLSFWFAQQKVPIYTATAAVKFEQSTTLSGLLLEVLQYNPATDSIETQASLIRSYPILEEVARRMGRIAPTMRGEVLRESKSYSAILDGIAAKLKTARVGGTSILEITASSTLAHEARDLANTVAEVYRDYNRQVRNGRITEARKFIEHQLKDVEARVRQAEEEVWAFREANRIISPGAESAILLNVFTQIRTDMERTRQQREELERTQARLARAGPEATGERVFVDGGNPALQKLQATQVELLLERNSLALEVTDRHPRLQAIEDRMRDVRREMRNEISAQIAALRSREEILGRQMGELFRQNREVPAVELNLQRLQRNAKTNDDLLTLLKTRHQEALIKEAETVEEVSIIRPAGEPIAVGGDALNTVLLGALLGLMLGLVLAFIQETLDTSIGTIEDVENYLQVPVLGIVPHIDARETMERLIERRPELAEVEPDALQNHALLITHFDPKSPVAEAYRTLRTNIQFMRVERAGKALVVTSPTLQEGKTTTIVNLAITMAQNGQRTLLIGSNLRRPSIHRFFGIDREPGLSDILVGTVAWRECIRTVADILMGRFEMEDIMASPGLDNLHIIEAGPVPANPSELLSTPAMSAFLREVREEYDIVLIDTPPVLPVTDAAVVAAQVDGVVLVYQAGKVGRLVLKRAKTHLEAARASVWGVVLNDVQTEIAGYASQYYTHYYGEEAPATGPTRLERLWAAVRGRLRGAPAGRASDVETPEGQDDEAVPVAAARSGRPRYRDGLKGLLVIVGLSAVIVGLVSWHLGWFEGLPLGEEPAGKQLESRQPPGPAEAPAPAADPQPVASVVPPPGTPSAPPATGGVVTAPPPSPAPAPAPTATTTPAAPVAPAPTSPVAPAPGEDRPPPDARFAVEFGPFAALPEAERVERRLGQAGFQTVRFRQQTGGGLYAVLVERVPTAREAQALLPTLREQGFGEATVLPGSEPLNVRVGTPLALRGAVQLAERLRARGHAVRVAAMPGEAENILIRHGNFASRQEAEERAGELTRLGLANHVVRVK
jgi:succinoglycan biosynthesis transport protein ExoP